MPANRPVPDETCIEEFVTCGRETLSSSAACWVVSSACTGTTVTPWPAAVFASTSRITSSAAAGKCTDSEVPAPGISNVSAPAVDPQ